MHLPKATGYWHAMHMSIYPHVELYIVHLPLSGFATDENIPYSQPRPSLLVLNRFLVPLSPLLQQLPLHRTLRMLHHRQMTLHHPLRDNFPITLRSERHALILARFRRLDHVVPRADLKDTVEREDCSRWWGTF